MRVAVIGAGPSGLVTLKYLLAAEQALGTAPVEARLFETEAGVGGTFLTRMYEDAELVSSKQLTSFSDFRVEDDTDFLTAERYVQYLNDYCTHFGLWPHMNFSCLITSLKKGPNGVHELVYTSNGQQHTWEFDAIAICSGLHVEPNIPRLEGVERVPVVLHSSEFKSRQQFGVDKTVLILGSGETSSDVSYLAVTAPTKRVVLCHRNGFHLAPKTNPNPLLIFSRPRSEKAKPQVPIDVSRASLFDTAYVHPWLRNSSILWKYYDLYLRWILWTSWGTTHGYDQWIGGKPDGWTAAEIFFNKAGHKVSHYMSAAWRPRGDTKSLLAQLRDLIVVTPVRDTGGRSIDVAPWPDRIDEHGVVHFRDNGRPEYAAMLQGEKVRPDVLVLCTGYQQTFPFLQDGSSTSCPPWLGPPTASFSTSDDSDSNDDDYEDGEHKRDDNPMVRGIWRRADPTVAYIGFVRPNLGAIPPLAEMQAQLWVLRLLAPERVAPAQYPSSSASSSSTLILTSTPEQRLRPEDESHYRLTSRGGRAARVRYGVDHESYAYQLALDMDAAPSLLSGDVLRSPGQGRGWTWKLPLVCALGANFNTKFRLRGPWAWDGAVDILQGELWETVARREWFFGHFTLSVVPMAIFGPLSLLVFLVAELWALILRLLPATEMRRAAKHDE